MFEKRLPLNAIILAAIFVFLSFTAASAQVPTATLTGTVQDPTGGYVVGVRIVLRNSANQTIATASTNEEGRFTIATLPLGAYTLTADAAGFEPLRKEINVSIAPMTLPLTLRVSGARESVTVTAPIGYAVVSAEAGTKMDLPLMETPIGLQVIGRKVLDDQQTVNLIDALVNISGVTPTNDSFGTSDSFSVRGFDAAALLYQDGARMDEYSDSGIPQDMANVESVEVVKGPESVLFGQGEPGGLVNVITKKPGTEKFTTFSQQFGLHRFYRSVSDTNLPLIGDKLLGRLVLDWTDAHSFRNFGFTRELNAYPSLVWNPSHRVELVLRTSYERGGLLLDPGIPFQSPQIGALNQRIIAITGPAKVSISSNFIDYGVNNGTGWQFDIRPELRIHFGEGTDLRLQYKHFYTTADPNPPTTETYFGDANVPGTPYGSLNRFGFTETYFHHRTDQVTSDVPARFKFDGIENRMLIGFDFSKDNGAYDYNGGCPQAINIYAPVYNQPIDYSPNCFLYGYGWNTLGYLAYGAYFQDFITLPHHLFVMAGVRQNWAVSFEDHFAPNTPTNDTEVHDRPANPRAGLLWQPIQKISLYSNYSSNYGDSGPLVTVGAQKFLPPQSADQVEFGAKSEWLDKKLTASAAVYRIIKHNVPAPDPLNQLLTIAVGTARTEGVELDVAGQITPDLRVIASYSNLQDLVAKDTNCDDPNNSNCSGIPSQQGLPFDGIAHVTGSLWATWQPHQRALRGLTVGSGLNGRSAEHYFQYTSLPVFTSNPTACQVYPPDPTQCTTGFEDDRVPNASQVNLMAAYRQNWGRKQLSAQVNIRNLLNNYSFSSLGYEGALPNTPFQIMPQLEFKF
jgi:iron complex outermembrane receptor protein